MSMMSDLILVGDFELSRLDFAAANSWPHNKNSQHKTMKKLNLKFDLKRFTIFALIGAVIIFIILRAPHALSITEIVEFNRDLKNYNAKLQVYDESNEMIAEFKIAIADSQEKKMYGLMNLEKLPQDQGMLFPFFKKQVVAMWMKNTLIPLDMIFIDSNDKIATIKTNTEPHSLEIISSEKEVTGVLEINAGLAKKLKLKEGQKVKVLK